MGVNSTAAYAAENNDMPKIFSVRWAKNNMPIGAALINGVAASLICVLGVVIDKFFPDSSLFWSFFALNLVMFLLAYLPMFPAFLKLRKIDPDTKRPFRVPGKPGLLKVMALVPMALILISVIFTAVPFSIDSQTLASVLPITIGSVLCLVIGEILIVFQKKGGSATK
jgi:amino acid transporter